MSALLGFVVLFILVCCVSPTIVYCLWDDTMVKFFGVDDVTWLDSLWISIISATLFKSSPSTSRD